MPCPALCEQLASADRLARTFLRGGGACKCLDPTAQNAQVGSAEQVGSSRSHIRVSNPPIFVTLLWILGYARDDAGRGIRWMDES